ncbi:hypothetical protein ACJRO7_021414 [Eucalyptus globulus]|uniref:F-box domain-containing protein n=1 Tax=Eucalyptus globulus TaxID=34317 RepID=A0ABD3KK02_EUCGL
MAETSAHGAIHRKSSGDRPDRTKRNGPPPPPPQRSRSPRDLLSALPDAVIHHIFSFLPIRDVVKTSTLSQLWRFAWTTIADLVFDGESGDPPRKPLDFMLLVGSSFHVNGFEYEKAHRPKVDLWLRFVAEFHVEDLC